MLTIISGEPGQGKTIFAMEDFLIKEIKEGRKVYTNIEGVFEKIYKIAIYCKRSHLHIEEQLQPLPPKLSTVDNGSLVIIDEIQNYFNARSWASENSQHFNLWLSKHRHFGIDVIGITQDNAHIDAQIRRLAKVSIRMTRPSSIGVKSHSLAIYYQGGECMKENYIGRKVYKLNPDVFELYSSYINSDIKEKHDPTKNMLKHPVVILTILAIGYLVYRASTGSIIPQFNKKTQSVKEEKITSLTINNPIKSQCFVNYSCVHTICKSNLGHIFTEEKINAFGYYYNSETILKCE